METSGRLSDNGTRKEETITFDERIKTRYLKYQMVTVPSRVDITKFYIYAWE